MKRTLSTEDHGKHKHSPFSCGWFGAGPTGPAWGASGIPRGATTEGDLLQQDTEFSFNQVHRYGQTVQGYVGKLFHRPMITTTQLLLLTS